MKKIILLIVLLNTNFDMRVMAQFNPCDGDTIGPVILVEAQDTNMSVNYPTLEADYLAWLLDNGGAEAQEECWGITWSFEEGTYFPDCGFTAHYDVVFMATDVCGNTSTTTALFALIDTVAPLITSGPFDYEYDPMFGTTWEEEYFFWIEYNGFMTATDVGPVPLNYSHDVVDSVVTSLGVVVTVDFFVTDDCGNESDGQAVYTYEAMTIGIQEIERNSKLIIYPNPNYGHYFIESDFDYEIFTVDGKRIIAPFAKGIYYVKSKYETIKMIILE